jgi:hypothetical protein
VALETAGYVPVERGSADGFTTILLRAGANSARVTHHWRRHCLTLELPPGRSIHRYYQACCPEDLARLAAAVAEMVHPFVARVG